MGVASTLNTAQPIDPDAEAAAFHRSTPGRTAWFHWHEAGTSKQEKKLIVKLDWFILSYGCLCFFNKYLDQQNVTNAYNSGMKEALNFGAGNELSWMNTYFNIGNFVSLLVRDHC